MIKNMRVNVNGLRRNAARAYTALCDKLHANIQDGSFDLIPEDIQQEMDDLRMGIASFMCVFISSDDMFSDLSDECDNIPHFNEEPEE